MSVVQNSYPYALTQLISSFAVVLINYSVVFEHFRRTYTYNEEAHEQKSMKSLSTLQLSSSPSSASTKNFWSNATSADTSSVPKTPTRSPSRSTMFKRPTSEKVKRKQKMAMVMTVICVVTSLIRSTQGLYLKSSAFRLIQSPLYCSVMIQTIGILYATSKAALYSVFINRIDMSYCDTMYSYSERTIRICYSIVLIEYLMLIGWSPFAIGSETERVGFTPDGQRVNSGRSDRGIKVCRPVPGLFISAVAVLFDMIFMGSMVVMFVRPLRKIFAQESDVYQINQHVNSSSSMRYNNNYKNYNASELRRLEFRLLPIKYTILSVTAVATSCFALIFLGSGIDLLQTWDNPINVCALLMMTKVWKREYWLVCGPVLKSLHYIHLVNSDTHEIISGVIQQLKLSKQKQTMDRLSVAHRVLNSASITLELGDIDP